MQFTLLHHKTLLLNQKQMSVKMSGSIKNKHTHTKKSIMYSYSITYVHHMVRVLWAAGSLIWSKEKQPKQKNSKDDLKKQKQKNTRVSSLYQVN